MLITKTVGVGKIMKIEFGDFEFTVCWDGVLYKKLSRKGSECGVNFDELKYIIDNTKHSDKLMVCFDTCHMNDSGYDMSKFDNILDEFDNKIGLDKLGCIHVNDSKNNNGSKKDRHANIGYGTIGFNNLINIIYNKRVESIPKILETPWYTFDKESYPPYKFEIEMIRNKKFNENLEENIKNYYLQ